MAKIDERNQARALRRQGLSFREIQAIVGVSKGTLNRWLKDIELTDDQRQRLLDRALTGREKARARGAWQNRMKRRQRIAATFEQARREFPQRIHDPLFTVGVVLYWAEGTVTGLPQSQFRAPYFKPTPHKIKKNPTYMGCCRLVVHSSDLFWRLRAWQEELVRYLGISLPSDLVDGASHGRIEAAHLEGRPQPGPGDLEGGQLPQPPGGSGPD